MNNLYNFISQTISDEGPMPFDKFMQTALYHPLWGYYSSSRQKFGPQGDFITAPELTPLFGQTLALFCQQILTTVKNPAILEFGAGSGQLCVDILSYLKKLDCLPEHYFILELSADLKLRQQEKIQTSLPEIANLVIWLDKWPTSPINGVILANEVLDAMPVHRFLQTETALLESHINSNAGKLEEVFLPCTNSKLQKHVAENLPKEPRPYLSEANLYIDGWIEQAANILGQGAMLLIDYGFPSHEFYHPDRSQGTLICHHQHKTQTNFLLNIGEQDLTAHVDFTHVASAGVNAGLHVAGYTSQAAFLLSAGVLSLLEAIEDPKQKVLDTQAVKTLTQAQEMGELFKVIALTKQLDLTLSGFSLYDKRGSL